MVLSLDTRRNYGEERMIGIGLLRNGVVLVVFAERGDATIRLISARKATQHERDKFKDEIGY